MNLRKTKVFGCGIAVLSFLMLSAFNTAPSDAPENADSESLKKSVVVSELGISVSDMVNSVEEYKQEQLEIAMSSPWYNKAMPDIEEAMNIRQEANPDSEVVGVIYKGNTADVIEEGDGWSKVRSGEVEGYVENSYLVIGDEAEEIANRDGAKIGTVTTDGLRMRLGPGLDQKIAGFANTGNQYQVVEELEGWNKVHYNGHEYYMASEYMAIERVLGVAKTVQQIEEEEAARRAAEEKAAAEAAAAEAAAAAAREKAAQEKAAAESKPASTDNSAVVSSSDLALMAAIIECEAGGESYEGKIAVGAVVMNRVRSGSFPNSINGVIYQSGQFGPASSGKLAKVLARGANGSCVQAAQEAMNGANNVGGALYFKSASAGKGTIIGNHCFY